MSKKQTSIYGPLDTAYLWLVETFAVGTLPRVRRYRFRRWANHDNGAVVWNKGAVHHIPAAFNRSFCTTESHALAEVQREISRQLQAVAAVKKELLAALKELPIQVIPEG